MAKTQYDAVAVWSEDVRKAGITHKRILTLFRKRAKGGHSSALSTAELNLAYVVRKAASAALDRLGRE